MTNDSAKWVSLGGAVLMLGSFIFSALAYQTAVKNRLSLASLEGRVQIKTEDRYTAQNAAMDFEIIREMLAADKNSLAEAVKTRDQKFEQIFKRLDVLENRLQEQSNNH